jgi:ribosome-binding protein aMBF1 (putative translation factor)
VDVAKKRRLEAAGWAVGDASDFLELTREEVEFIEMKLALAEGLREERETQGLTQAELARRVGSSQSRVAKMEAADPSVSVDLMLRSLLKLGARRADVAKLVTRKRRRSNRTA